ncbi:polysaccharide deacetylase family protein [Ferrovibrio sp.]|uniref:polysaccharide deacetylase family protein n=1 Tax=Ferrovibrio sp. TaxID=1917215 RepID=UPI00311D7A12
MTASRLPWHRLTAELDLWQDRGQTASFWWRDDDAVTVTPALEHLLALQAEQEAPLLLAVIPRDASPTLAARLRGLVGVCAAQHGFGHVNHALQHEKKSEFPAARAPEACRNDLGEGRRRLAALGLEPAPVLVPPWNRFAADLLPALPRLGYQAISAYKPRESYWAAPDLVQLNTHLDPVDWHGSGPGHGPADCFETCLRLLEAQRLGQQPPQPIGLLSHHLRHDAAEWDFLAGILSHTGRHPAARWLDWSGALAIGRPDQSIAPRPVTPRS